MNQMSARTDKATPLQLCSYVKYFRFEITDRAFVENVGAVCVGSLMRRRILEAGTSPHSSSSVLNLTRVT